MSLLNAVILGIVEGLTEFLPISSTAHLILTSKLLGIKQSGFQEFFEVFIQSGAIIAVFFMYLKYILDHEEIQLKILTSFIPTAIIGVLFYKVIKNTFFVQDKLIFGAIFVVGVVFLIVEYLIKNEKIKLSREITNITYQQALFVGVAQSLAILPGVSRAGIVMVAMMLLRFKRADAALYSFLLAIPTILAAAFYDVYKTGPSLFLYSNKASFLVVGFLTSLVTAVVAVRWFINYLKKYTLTPFGIYRIILAIILVLVILR